MSFLGGPNANSTPRPNAPQLIGGLIGPPLPPRPPNFNTAAEHEYETADEKAPSSTLSQEKGQVETREVSPPVTAVSANLPRQGPSPLPSSSRSDGDNLPLGDSTNTANRPTPPPPSPPNLREEAHVYINLEEDDGDLQEQPNHPPPPPLTGGSDTDSGDGSNKDHNVVVKVEGGMGSGGRRQSSDLDNVIPLDEGEDDNGEGGERVVSVKEEGGVVGGKDSNTATSSDNIPTTTTANTATPATAEPSSSTTQTIPRGGRGPSSRRARVVSGQPTREQPTRVAKTKHACANKHWHF